MVSSCAAGKAFFYMARSTSNSSGVHNTVAGNCGIDRSGLMQFLQISLTISHHHQLSLWHAPARRPPPRFCPRNQPLPPALVPA
jgi:hypothetical protein